MWRHLRKRVVTPANRRRVVQDRRNIVSALRARDASGARAAMVALLERAERRYFGEDEMGAGQAAAGIPMDFSDG